MTPTSPYVQALFPYIAEPVIAQMIEEQPSVLAATIESDGRHVPDWLSFEGTAVTALTRRSLRWNPPNLSFDGCHTLDIAILVRRHGEQTIIPVEVKAGKTPRSVGKLDKECSTSDHKPPRVAGTMIQILGRNFSPKLVEHIGGATLVAVVDNEEIEVSPNWLLIASETVINVTNKASFRNPPTPISIKNLCQSYGDAKKFDDLIRRLLRCGSYFHEWIAKEPTEPDDEQYDS